MSIEKVKDLIKQLQTELKKTDQEMDAAVTHQFEELDEQLNGLLSENNELNQDFNESFQNLEYEFLTNHPVASGLIREMIDILSKAGI